ncbi:MAG: UDP-N-acetylmuramoyl-L-alanyl-D-glutamate--2,6-diaminopimelate ligase [Firmicutes bacterium]|nr:UDP-N-acetylmuramoyl-L-alanyl-D-glutamate--2,6-diaminopimelate ligase [Bacillota bacterium]
MILSTIFPGAADVEIKGLCLDSRKIKEGDMFFCLKGLEADGHRFAGKAAEGGAVAIVHSDDLEQAEGVSYIKVEDVNYELNRISNLFNGQPSHKMTVFGVTGTNGKSTTTSIISDVYEKGGHPCGYMGTIAVRYGNVSRVPSLTTPDAVEIHDNLRLMVEHGMEAVAMEVSSHGLSMGRVDSVDFDVAMFTNMTYDHLDYHKTMEAYFEAKQVLFKNMKPEGVAVLNVDDISFEELRKCCKCKVVTYGVDRDCDYRGEDIKLAPFGSEFTLVHGGARYEIKTNMVALYNIYNLLGAIACMHQAGMSIEDMIPHLEDIAQVDGRMEIINEGQDFALIVDYAHTPDGFDKIFDYADEIAEGHDIYAVFGCAGKRDKPKRKVLGAIAGKHCKTVYLCEEDPRDEHPADIAAMIDEGVRESGGHSIFIEDRYVCIEQAIKNAKAGDCVLILGKGAEQYLDRADGKHEWMGDVEAAKQAVEKVLGK